MADAVFEHPRLVEIYDTFDGSRRDLDPYLALIRELGARSVVDIGCGTGSFACLASANHFDVTAIDPAEASIIFAQRKPGASRVRWLVGDSSMLPNLAVDVAIMTGNVAQVFITDQAWNDTLRFIHKALHRHSRLVFEVRDPARKAWTEWTREKTFQRLFVPSLGYVQGWCEVMQVLGELVSFRWTYIFESDGEEITSDSTIRFRTREAIEASLHQANYRVHEVRDAPDRPGREMVFICSVA